MPSEQLSNALDSAYQAIIAGRISDLGNIAVSLESGLSGLGRASQSELQTIREKAARNALCLDAAIKGVRAAQRRVAELRNASKGHATYNCKGEKALLESASGVLRERI